VNKPVGLDRVFGDGVFAKYGNAALDDAKTQLALSRYLRAAPAAALGAFLAGKKPWSAEEDSAMAEALWEELVRRLEAGDLVTAASRGGHLRLLAGDVAWPESVEATLREAVKPTLASGQSWRRAYVATLATDYLRLGGSACWDATALDQMLAAVAEDFQVCVKRGDALMAAERLAQYLELFSTAPAD
jgi:hypothetical protein